MKSDSVVVKKSKIHGKGIFATKEFFKGDVVLHWDLSHIVPDNEVENMTNDQKLYATSLNGLTVVMQSPEKYINHSCEPNTESRDLCDFAIKDIKIGEEITSDYSNGMPPNTSMDCNCDSQKCRKIIKTRICSDT